MIIPNGYIQTSADNSKQCIDEETGFPTTQAIKPTWREPIPCQYIASHYNAQALSNNEHFTQAKFWILIDGLVVTENTLLRLTDAEHNEIGVFPITQVELLRAVNQTKIWV